MSDLGRTAALVPAAGRGERLGAGVPKALRSIGGTPILVHAVHALASSRVVDLVVHEGAVAGLLCVRLDVDASAPRSASSSAL